MLGLPGIPYWRLSGFYFFYFAVLGAWLPYWSLFLEDEGFDAPAIGMLSAIMMATKIVAPSIWGWLGDRSGKRLAIIRLGSALALLCFLLVFYDRSFAALAVVIFCYSFFWNAVLPQFEVVTLSHMAGRYQYYSRIRVWGSVGFILAVALLGLWFDTFSLQTLPIVLAILLAGIWLSSLVISEKPVPAASESGQGIGSILKTPAVWVFFTACMLLQVSHGPYYTFYSIYLDGQGFDRTLTGLLWSLGVLAEVVLFIWMHKVLDRWSIRKIVLLSLALSTLRWILIGAFAEHIVVLVFAQLLHAASFGSFHAIAIEFVRRYFGGGHQGQGQAIYSGLSFGLGGAIGALASGYIWQFSPQLTFYLAGAACALAYVLSWFFVRGEAVENTVHEGDVSEVTAR